ncbi:hypothetical protein [Algicella marina]|uniref:Uncharacterized protein n=1 Tax=Algicella marina TaxID=2683284 RepID=A0A6P1T1C5_9RHOB|nr:hypothetical protein [Algicella marina]QHQ36714.1 hypothetical protein GO499_16800 [Algicella marina]
MEAEAITLVLSPSLRRELEKFSSESAVSPGEFIARALEREFATPRGPEDSPLLLREIRAIRIELADEFAFARNWRDLQGRLARHGFTLRHHQGNLMLLRWPGGAPVCPATSLGGPYERLRSRLAVPFPELEVP